MTFEKRIWKRIQKIKQSSTEQTVDNKVYNGKITDMTYCDKITKDTHNLMLELMRDTRLDGKERYIGLCEDIKGNIVHSKEQCTGTECSVPSEKADILSCPIGTKQIGDYHTHPNGDITISRGDILHTAISNRQFFCIGTSKKDIVKCHGIKDHTISEMGSDIRRLIDKGEMREAKRLINIAEDIMDMHKIGTEPLGSESYWGNVLDARCKITWHRSDSSPRKYIARVTKE
jgi:proteasome lid subunit RPN8/RPN11